MKTMFAIPLVLFLSSLDGLGSEHVPHICFISSSNRHVHMPSLRGDYLFWAHDLALKDFRLENPTSTNSIKRIETNGTDLSLLSGAEKFRDFRCRAVTGLFTSREALLVAPFLKKADVFGYSVSASHSELSRWNSHLKSGAPSSSTYIDTIKKWTQRRMFDRIIVLKTRDDLYSNHYFQQIQAALNRPIQEISILSEDEIPTQQLDDILKLPRTLLILTTYPIPSLPILKQLKRTERVPVGLSILGSPSWSFDLATLRQNVQIFRSDIEYFFPDVWKRSTKSAQGFRKRFFDQYGVAPEADAAFAYDATRQLLDCIRVKKSDRKSLNLCLSNRGYSGVSGSFRFNLKEVFAGRDIHIVPLKELLKESF